MGERTLIVVSLSRFDLINAAYGRSTGDRILEIVASRLREWASGSRAEVARGAGPEFVITVRGEPQGMADDIQARLRRPMAVGDRLIAVDSAAGITELDPHEDVADAVSRARIATEIARDEGMKVGHWSPATDLHLAFRRSLQSDLLRAIEGQQIELLFQPQYAVADGALIGVEALARWQHPTYGQIGADGLFTAALRANAMPQLAEYLHERAFAVVAAWPEALRGLRVSVNVTPEEVVREDFASRITDAVLGAGLDPRLLTLEITEHDAIVRQDHAATTLSALREQGFAISLDDFGTGYSSLAYLSRLPLDAVKLDRALLADIAGNSAAHTVVATLIDMAHRLGLKVIAEGIETEAQFAILRALRCDVSQGFYHAPALTTAQLLDAVQAASLASPRLI